MISGFGAAGAGWKKRPSGSSGRRLNADDFALNLFGVVPSLGMPLDDEELKRTEKPLHLDRAARHWNMVAAVGGSLLTGCYCSCCSSSQCPAAEHSISFAPLFAFFMRAGPALRKPLWPTRRPAARLVRRVTRRGLLQTPWRPLQPMGDAGEQNGQWGVRSCGVCFAITAVRTTLRLRLRLFRAPSSFVLC